MQINPNKFYADKIYLAQCKQCASKSFCLEAAKGYENIEDERENFSTQLKSNCNSYSEEEL